MWFAAFLQHLFLFLDVLHYSMFQLHLVGNSKIMQVDVGQSSKMLFQNYHLIVQFCTVKRVWIQLVTMALISKATDWELWYKNVHSILGYACKFFLRIAKKINKAYSIGVMITCNDSYKEDHHVSFVVKVCTVSGLYHYQDLGLP